MVARLLWEQDVAGSNPVTSTKKQLAPAGGELLFSLMADGENLQAQIGSTSALFFSKEKPKGLAARVERFNYLRILSPRPKSSLPPQGVSCFFR